MEPIQLMSDSEKEIMEIIWDNGGRIYISELLEAVAEAGREWKRTTVRDLPYPPYGKGIASRRTAGEKL